MLPPNRNSGSRLLPCIHYLVMQLQMFWNFQSSNSRGQRMVDPVIMYQNYGTPAKSEIINLQNKQVIFPVDDDSDIIIVNEDYNRNTIEEGFKVDKEKDQDLVETTTVSEISTPSDAHEYIWKTTDWSACDAACGQVGHEVRGAVCQHKRGNETTTVETTECLTRIATQPAVLRECSGSKCENWTVSPWAPVRCSPTGIATSRRRVECVSQNGSAVADSACGAAPPRRARVAPARCAPHWSAGAWSKCIGECGSAGRQHRVLRCVWRYPDTRRRPRRERASALCAPPRPPVARDCTVTCVRHGVCKDTSRYCDNVRAMNMCAIRRYKDRCCKTCD